MVNRFNRWLLEIFSNSDVNKLVLALAFGALALWAFMAELAPILGAVLVAYVLEGVVGKLRRFGLGRALATSVVVAGAVVVAIFVFYALPRFLLELRELGGKIPETERALAAILALVNRFIPAEAAIDHAQVAAKGVELTGDIAAYLINNLFAYAGNVFSALVYLILLPLLVFFLLRDKWQVINYLLQFMPSSPIFAELWAKLDQQFGAYIRGKILEAAVIGTAMWIVLLWFRMEYALSLSILVGLSVFVPFVGAIAVTFPVVLFAFLQFGWSSEFTWVVGWYTLIQIIDGQVLVPLLFSNVIRIHPVALFFSLLFFGNLWGVWGVFFAIPLASLIRSIIAVIVARRAPAAVQPPLIP